LQVYRLGRPDLVEESPEEEPVVQVGWEPPAEDGDATGDQLARYDGSWRLPTTRRRPRQIVRVYWPVMFSYNETGKNVGLACSVFVLGFDGVWVGKTETLKVFCFYSEVDMGRWYPDQVQHVWSNPFYVVPPHKCLHLGQRRSNLIRKRLFESAHYFAPLAPSIVLISTLKKQSGSTHHYFSNLNGRCPNLSEN
jgi:hypothetical protein